MGKQGLEVLKRYAVWKNYLDEKSSNSFQVDYESCSGCGACSSCGTCGAGITNAFCSPCQGGCSGCSGCGGWD